MSNFGCFFSGVLKWFPHCAVTQWWPYLVVAIFATWPLAGSLLVAIPYGCEAEATVPLFNLWTLWWNVDRAGHGFSRYWDAPIFYPTRGAFAFSEAQPTMVVSAPVIWLTGNRVLAYNLYQLLILSLNGWSGQRLLTRMGHRPWLALCGGAMCELLPFVWWQLGVVQLTTLFGIIWTVHSLIDLFDERPRAAEFDGDFLTRDLNDARGSQDGSDRRTEWRSRFISLRQGACLGASFGLTYLLCNYWGLFLAILLIPSSVWFWNRRLLQREFWVSIVLGGLVAAAMIGPIAYMQRTLSAEHTWEREADLINGLSAHPRDYTDVPWTPLVPALEMAEQRRDTIWPLGGGGLKLLLAPIGLMAALATRGRRRWGLFAATFGLIAFGLSLGPENRIASYVPFGLAGASPYELLQRYLPGFALIRSPFRFALFVQLATVWLSVEALDLLNPRRWKRSTLEIVDHETSLVESDSARPTAFCGWRMLRSRILCGIPLALAGMATTFEVRPAQQRLFKCPSSRDLPVWVLWLRDQASPDQPIACLPFPVGYTVKDYEATAMWMYWGTFHRHPLVNGYSGFFPRSFLDVKEGLEQLEKASPKHAGDLALPQLKLCAHDNPGLAKLNASGAVYAIVRRSYATRDDVWAHFATKFRWAWVAGDETEQIDIYRIEPPLAE